MTVEEAVINLLIDYKERGIKYVPIHLVEQAHPEHQLSGRARLRGLRKRGLEYRYDITKNAYIVLSDLSVLYEIKKNLHLKNHVASKQGVDKVIPKETKKEEDEELVSPEEFSSLIQEIIKGD